MVTREPKNLLSDELSLPHRLTTGGLLLRRHNAIGVTGVSSKVNRRYAVISERLFTAFPHSQWTRVDVL